MELKDLIRDVPDFPIKGIIFKDITTLLKDNKGFKITLDELYNLSKNKGITKVIGVESRGFIFGGALAAKLAAGFVPIRKPGKLPDEILKEEYTLEYGKDSIEKHVIKAIDLGFKVKEIPSNHRGRQWGKSSLNLKIMGLALWDSLKFGALRKTKKYQAGSQSPFFPAATAL